MIRRSNDMCKADGGTRVSETQRLCREGRSDVERRDGGEEIRRSPDEKNGGGEEGSDDEDKTHEGRKENVES